MGQLQKLHYNVETLQAQAAAIANIEADLRGAKEQLSSSLETLRGDWQSDASTKFFSAYDTTWLEQIEKYCTMLAALSEALAKAASEYSPLESEYNRINI